MTHFILRQEEMRHAHSMLFREGLKKIIIHPGITQPARVKRCCIACTLLTEPGIRRSLQPSASPVFTLHSSREGHSCSSNGEERAKPFPHQAARHCKQRELKVHKSRRSAPGPHPGRTAMQVTELTHQHTRESPTSTRGMEGTSTS